MPDSGVYYAVVDDTDRGSVKPPWSGVNDRVKFKMSALVFPSFSDAPVNLQNDAALNGSAAYSRLLETSSRDNEPGQSPSPALRRRPFPGGCR